MLNCTTRDQPQHNCPGLEFTHMIKIITIPRIQNSGICAVVWSLKSQGKFAIPHIARPSV